MKANETIKPCNETDEVADQSSKFKTLVTRYKKKGWRHFSLLIWALIGPGLLAMIGDNDAGRVLEYVIRVLALGLDY